MSGGGSGGSEVIAGVLGRGREAKCDATKDKVADGPGSYVWRDFVFSYGPISSLG